MESKHRQKRGRELVLGIKLIYLNALVNASPISD